MSMVLPDAHLIDADLDMGARHTELQDLAIAYRGACVRRFNQGDKDLKKGIGKWILGGLTQGRRMGGVCHALSGLWIASHATDQDFWGNLQGSFGYRPTTTKGIIALQNGYIRAVKSGRVNSLTWMHGFLRGFGIREKFDVATGAETATRQVPGAAAGGFMGAALAGFNLARDIAPDWNAQTQGYRLIAMFGPGGGGHAMAAWAAQDVCFFDPNYGEFWFEKAEDFRQWFGCFWERTGYGRRYTQAMRVLNYAKSAR